MLVQRCPADECGLIVEKLASLIVDPAVKGSRDTWADGLKGIITNIPYDHGRAVCVKLATILLRGLQITKAAKLRAKTPSDDEKQDEDMSIETITLDVLRNLFVRFGEDLSSEFIPALMCGIRSSCAELMRFYCSCARGRDQSAVAVLGSSDG